MMMSKLYDAAVTLLKKHAGDILTCAPKFAAAVRADKAMQNDLCADYLGRVLADIRHGETVKVKADASRSNGPRQRRKSTKTGLPTAAQKRGAIRMATAAATSFLDTKRLRDGRLIGDVRFAELPKLSHGAAYKSVEFLSRGLEDAADAIFCQMLSLHVQPTNSDQRIRDAVKAPVAEKMFAKAMAVAAQRIAEASARTARDLLGPGGGGAQEALQ